MNRYVRAAIASFSLMMVGFFVSMNANAALVTTEQMVNKVSTGISRDQILVALEREDVRRMLVANGVSVDHARARVDTMTDAEVTDLQQNFESLPAGAGAGSILATVILVFVVLDIVGVTNVFTFIN